MRIIDPRECVLITLIVLLLLAILKGSYLNNKVVWGVNPESRVELGFRADGVVVWRDVDGKENK